MYYILIALKYLTILYAYTNLTFLWVEGLSWSKLHLALSYSLQDVFGHVDRTGISLRHYIHISI